ncbi:hypothetical protein QBC44DRAFT_140046 [Cladorrhinum sp. PSN332]|nr:hypothetical protein QBC44DRAFT_140046 [Cladorrhinum sp. PSN332]
MESWSNTNIYTTNPVRWVELMNISTAELSIGLFPSNLIAIPGLLSGSHNITIPPGSLVIEKASETLIESRNIESVIFGAASAIVIVVILLWVAAHWLLKIPLVHPKATNSRETRDEESGTTVFGGGSNLTFPGNGNPSSIETTAHRFASELSVYYTYVPDFELHQKALEDDDLAPQDVEAGTELLRKRYEKQITLISTEGSHEHDIEDKIKMQMDAQELKLKYEQLLGRWYQDAKDSRGMTRWTDEEMAELKEMIDMIKSQPGHVD